MNRDEAKFLPYPFRTGKAPAPHMKQIGYQLPPYPDDRAGGYGTSLEAAEGWFENAKAMAADLADPVFCNGYVIGWRPMTEKERERSEASRKRALDAAAKRRMAKEERERALLAELTEKYGRDA